MTTVIGSARTRRASRYAKQLAAHAESFGLGVRVTGEETCIDLGGAVARLIAADEELGVVLTGDAKEAVESARELVGSHLEAFGRREGLELTWS